MEISVNENSQIEIKKAYAGIVLISDENEKLGICMRDSGFEFQYGGKTYEAKLDVCREMTPAKNTETTETPNTPYDNK